MLNFKNKQLCDYILRQWSHWGQLMMLLEEMAELAKATCKIMRQTGERPVCTENFREELADVVVMIEQCKMMFDISDWEINQRASEKLERAIKRNEVSHNEATTVEAGYPGEAPDEEKLPADNESGQ